MIEYKIRYVQQAVDDMDAIFDYVVVENQTAAHKLLEQFDHSIQKLRKAPYLGAAIRTDDAMMIAEGYRYLVVAPYLIFYRVREKDVVIGRILHSRQDWLQLLFGIK